VPGALGMRGRCSRDEAEASGEGVLDYQSAE
jgi:hypothetical protein